jgi:excisionase family DNA binding protein
MSTTNRKSVAALQPPVKWEQKTAIPLSERPTLTVDEFCRMIGIGRSTFYKAVGAGDLKVRKYGKRTFITQEEMKRFVDKMPFGRRT